MSEAIKPATEFIEQAQSPSADAKRDTSGLRWKAAGLTSSEAAAQLAQDGPNSMPDLSDRPAQRFFEKLWAPIPWLLEAAMLLQLFLHRLTEAWIIGFLLIFNAVLSYVQEGRAQATLRALKSRLALDAVVRRDGEWKTVPSTQLVRRDVVKVSLGTVVPADLHLLDGSVLLDQSMLTGESLPVEADQNKDAYAGSLVRRGEAVGEVLATGVRTKFGRTAELVQTAKSVSSQQKTVLRIVRNLAVFNSCVVCFMAVYAIAHSMPWTEVTSLVLTGILAAIPVALPATFTLAAAVGARSLAIKGVLPTRLSAVDEAATIDVLCSDKTGTLTRNELSVAEVTPAAGYERSYVLAMAALASSDGGQDPVDQAIRRAAARLPATSPLPELRAFVPFDPEKKFSEATVSGDGAANRIIKGAHAAVSGHSVGAEALSTGATDLEDRGYRVLAVASGTDQQMQVLGLIALSDPPRDDSADLISQLRTLGVQTVMVTGDAAPTASTVARAVGLNGAVFPPGRLPDTLQPDDYAVFAGVLPEGKYELVKAFQRQGHAVGMCGDGANDAPALRQAELGVAVSTATDVAKSAAGVVLTEPGLTGIIRAVQEGRVAFQRILSYTIRSTSTKISQILLLGIGLLVTGHAVLTPTLVVLLMITGDFLAMALTTDRTHPSARPNSWNIRRITIAGVVFGGSALCFYVVVLFWGIYEMQFKQEQLRTLSAVAIVYGTQAITYAIRDREKRWSLRPTGWLIGSTCLDVLLISCLAVRGIAMAPLPVQAIGTEFLGAAFLFILLNLLKVPVFTCLHM